MNAHRNHDSVIREHRLVLHVALAQEAKGIGMLLALPDKLGTPV